MGAVNWYIVVDEPLCGCTLVSSTLFPLPSGFDSSNMKVGILYILSGFGGNVVSCLFLRWGNISVGASGALCGLVGAMLSDFIANWTIYVYKAATIFTVVVTMAISLGLGFLPKSSDNIDSLGGFLVGFLLGFIVLIRPRSGWSMRDQLPEDARVRIRKYFPYQQALFVLALLFLVHN
ncbi:hypothetical protein V2J09_000600 [Rumex salicifolius]